MPKILTELIKKVFKRSPKTNSSNFGQSYELISPKFQNDPSYPNNAQYRGNSSNDNDPEISGGKRKYRKKLLLTALAFCFLLFISYLMGFIKGRGVDMEEEFKKFVSKFDRNYSPHENELRKKHFKQSLEELLTLKKDLLRSSLFGFTEFMDWSPEEKKKLFGTVPMKKSYDRKFVPPQNFERKVKRDQAPENFDWREHGVVTPVKNQKNCGSCWAFSSVSVVESAIARHDNRSILDLSEQNLVDCVNGNGCEGGEPREALSYISTHGIAVESDYPYNAKYSDCKNNTKKLNYTIDWWPVEQDGHKNDQLTHNLYAMGPLVHDIWVPTSMLFLASSGVYKPSEVECRDAERKGDGHSVAVVGYGVDSDSGEPYWIIKNSWGTNWGDRGYFKLHRGSGLCSMGDPMLAVLVTAHH